jgi:hypothetical protein
MSRLADPEGLADELSALRRRISEIGTFGSRAFMHSPFLTVVKATQNERLRQLAEQAEQTVLEAVIEEQRTMRAMARVCVFLSFARLSLPVIACRPRYPGNTTVPWRLVCRIVRCASATLG